MFRLLNLVHLANNWKASIMDIFTIYFNVLLCFSLWILICYSYIYVTLHVSYLTDKKNKAEL